MTITFADGTRIEVSASALDDFVRHDLKWVEFVHGRAAAKTVLQDSQPAIAPSQPSVHRCPAC
jgi:hypothetical protein